MVCLALEMLPSHFVLSTCLSSKVQHLRANLKQPILAHWLCCLKRYKDTFEGKVVEFQISNPTYFMTFFDISDTFAVNDEQYEVR